MLCTAPALAQEAAERYTPDESVASALSAIPDDPKLDEAPGKYLAVFEIDGDAIIGKSIRDPEAGELGILCWNRVVALIPKQYREGVVQFNIEAGRRWAGRFGGDGKNDVGRKGYKFSIAKYAAAEEENLGDAQRPVTARRGTLDWTIVHEMGHYICLKTDTIERFSRQFDAKPNMPVRREAPDDYPEDGSPVTDGGFVTSYAERTPGDEEVVETFTTYITVDELPTNDSWAGRKIRFIGTVEGMAELREHVQAVGE
ncbi:MAG: hypothetical protein Phyf2KO_19890 [Phycisphaerales bacterium]